MRLQGRELEVGMTGSDVSLLHFELRLLGLDIPDEERFKNVFEDGTREAVARFQEEFGLEPTGQVTEETAERINEQVRERLSVDEILDRLLEEFQLHQEQLERLTAQNANLRRDVNRLRTSLEALQAEHDRLKEETEASAGRIAELEAALEAALARIRELEALLDGGSQDQPQVEGLVLFDHGLPADNLTLRVYHRGVGGRGLLLGETETDEAGFYRLHYQARDHEINLEVVAVVDDEETSLTATRFNARPREILNLVAPATIRPLDAEFSRLQASLKPLLADDLRLADMRENGQQQDITVLHRSTGWDARLIAMASTADRQADETGLSDKVIYGLMRAGLPSDPPKLAQVSADVFKQALTEVHEAGIIALHDGELDDVSDQFTGFIRQTRRAEKAPGALSNVGELLDHSGLDDNQRDTFADIYFSHRGSGPELWQKVGEALPEQVDTLRLQGKLAYLTSGNALLTESIQNEVGDLNNMTALVEQSLYDAAEWETRLKTLGNDDEAQWVALIPPAYEAETNAQRLSLYAEDMARRVRISYPLPVITHMIGTDKLVLGEGHAEIKEMLQPVLLKSQTLRFNFGQTSLDSFLETHKDFLFEGLDATDTAKVTEKLKLLHRLYQITPTDKALKVMLDEGFTAAADVVAFNYDQFLDRFGDKFDSRHEAALVHRKAQQVSATTQSLLTTANQLDSVPPIYALSPDDTTRAEIKKSLVRRFPTLQSLFGSLDFCECEHCRSVLSPAAYLVDLFQFLDPEPLVWQNFLNQWRDKHNQQAYPHQDPDTGEPMTPFDVLMKRRPDLPHLALTCENTQTALPYIDIVNEILEYAVAHDTLSAEVAHDTGDLTTPELLAEPQNILASAYTTLQAARYPLTLPYDRWIDMARGFCAHVEMPLPHLLETFRPADELFAPAVDPKPYYRSQIFAEMVGLSPAEYALFTDADIHTAWHTLYGFQEADDPADALETLKSAKTLAQHLAVSYQELVELVKTGFINPTLDQLHLLRKLGVEVDDVFRFKGGGGLPEFDAAEKAEFSARLATLSAAFADFEAETWLNEAWDDDAFAKALLLADPDPTCDFSRTTLRYADETAADSLVFLKFNLFVRLWRKLGWTIAETDRALQTFIPGNITDLTVATVGSAMRTALVYIAHLSELARTVKVGKQSRLKLLTLWGNLSTTGQKPLYDQYFLTPTVRKLDPIFDHPLGLYLSQDGLFVKNHLLAIQAALTLQADEIAQILTAADLNLEDAPLTLETVSLLYRYRLLADGLKLSVADLIALIELSGLKPFQPLQNGLLTELDEDHPFSQTLEFVKQATVVRQSGLRIGDLDYLFRHRFDPVGPYRDDGTTRLPLLKTLSSELQRIQTEQATPTDVAALSDESLRQKMALALPAEVIARFWAMWQGTVEWTVSEEGIIPDNQLAENAFATLPDVQVYYDDTRQIQQLTYRGLLFEARKTALTTAHPAPLFAALLNKVQAQAQTFFTRHFVKAVIGTEAVGFLEPADFDRLFAPLADDLTEPERQDEIQARRQILVNSFLPYLRQQLARRFVIETLATDRAVEPSLMTALLTDTSLLVTPEQPGQPLLNAFMAVGTTGLTAEYFATADLTGDPAQPASTVEAPTLVGAPAGVNSARFSGYLEVPVSGPYRFYVRLARQNATVTLTFADFADPILQQTAAVDGEEASAFVDLKAGIPYQLTVEIGNLQAGGFDLAAKGETNPRGALNQLRLYPQQVVSEMNRAAILVGKVLQLIQALPLNERELRYLTNHAEDFADLNFSQLPTQRQDDTPAKGRALFGQFLRLVGYAKLRADMAGGSDALIDIFALARRATPPTLEALCQGCATLTRRRDGTLVTAVAEALGLNVADFAQEQGVDRLWQALQLVSRFGIGVPAVVAITSLVDGNAPAAQREIVAENLRNAIKARYEQETWQRIAQPIFDQLRQHQRDALAAYVMQKKGLARIEQLFEEFLIDPGMEPVVQTSRVRLAISSVQLFIQRILLNLEAKVHPSTINARHWQWMKRYRVWEANRKIFLYPENWLEPEFRDDKTHLFQELEGTLLQGDVSADLVEDAFFSYLRQLEGLARLEMVTMYCEEKTNPADNVLHLIGRIHSIPHQYFYRRYAHQMWTPWEPVGVKIEGDHVVAVFWRERLHLFWVTFIEKGAENNEPAKAVGDQASKTLANVEFGKVLTSLSAVAGKKVIDIQLNWCEYAQGQWSTRESGGFGTVTKLVPATFRSQDVYIHATKEAYDQGEERGILIHLDYEGLNATFRVVSKNSPAELGTWQQAWELPYTTDKKQATSYRKDKSSGLVVNYRARIVTDQGQDRARPAKSEPHTILGKGIGASYSLLTCSNPIEIITQEIGRLVSPFFYQDNQHTFFVEPTFNEKTFLDWEEYTIVTPGEPARPHIPYIPDVPRYWPPLIEKFGPPNPLDPIALGKIREVQDWITNPDTVYVFDERLIGPRGGLNAALATPETNPGQLGAVVNVNPGSDIGQNVVVVALDNNTLTQKTGGVLTVIGDSGLNQTMVDVQNAQRDLSTGIDLPGGRYGGGLFVGQ